VLEGVVNSSRSSDATKESRLAAAMTPPFSFSSGRCWIRAFTGRQRSRLKIQGRPASPARERTKGSARRAGREHRHADRAQRNQSILDLAAGKIARGQAAQPNADGYRSLKNSERVEVMCRTSLP